MSPKGAVLLVFAASARPCTGRLIPFCDAASKMFQGATQFRGRGKFERPEIEDRRLDPQYLFAARRGKALHIVRISAAPHNEIDRRERKGRDGDDVQSPLLEKSGERRRRAAEQTPLRDEDEGPVVGDQAEAFMKGAEGEVALPRSRRPFDEGSAPVTEEAQGEKSGMADLLAASHQARGMATKKLAPTTSPSSRRFSAQMRPPWVSTIWRAMARPRPELPPKAAPLGREV